MKKPLIIGNWKMYVESSEEAKDFALELRRKARAFGEAEVWLAPSFPLIYTVAEALKGSKVRVGAQSISSFEDQQHTGEVSAPMLKDAGATFVLVGHSEQRAEGESNEMTAQALRHALRAGLTVVLCVGERERDPLGAHFEFIEEELTVLRGLEQKYASRVVVAYEPVWAIGKSASEAMRAEELEEMMIFIRKTLTNLFERPKALRIPLLYGGSVSAQNAKALIAQGGAGGLLVGRASTEVEPFIELLKTLK